MITKEESDGAGNHSITSKSPLGGAMTDHNPTTDRSKLGSK